LQFVAVADPRDAPRERLRAKLKLQPKDSVRDFREVVERKDIDTVAVATPDHWHVLIAMAAVRAGKDVYCEKPLSNTVAEGRALANVVERYGAVFQHGTQLHSYGGTRHACELVRNERIGKLQSIVIGSPPGKATGLRPAQPVPKNIDYNLWLGPAPANPYDAAVVNSTGWYFVSDYSKSGWIAGFGVHDIDIAQWGMGLGRTGPVEVAGKGVFPADGLYDTVLTYDLEYTYANGVKLIMTDTGKNRHGVTFKGTDGWVFTRGGCEASSKELLRETFGPKDVHLYRSPGHAKNFIDCVKSRAETITPIEVAHRATSTALIGGIAVKLGRRLKWDPDKERFLGDDEANRLLTCAMRPPWKL
jgi:predicted dehydrogenase